jgi:hypothetical protein
MSCHSRCTLIASLLSAIVLVGVLLPPTGTAQAPAGQRRVRARPPKFDQNEVSQIFFEDVFAWLVGTRPAPAAGSSKESSSGVADKGAMGGTTETESATGTWSQWISATTIEDEIKALKQSVDRTVTTPSSFAGRGHQVARLDFTLLAMLFAIIDQYDGDVRWQQSASLARDQFARTAANLKAGGAIQVYNECKRRKQDLDDLVRGSRLQGEGSDELVWAAIVDRPPLMQLLEDRLETNLKMWTSNGNELRTHKEAVIREAELTAAIAAVLLSEAMDDADDDEYRSFALLLRTGGQELAEAARRDDAESARSAMSSISRSCVDCHDIYR